MVRHENELTLRGKWTSRVMWCSLGVAILTSVLLTTGWLAEFDSWLGAGLVLAIPVFLVAGTIWERRSGVSRWRSQPWAIRKNLGVYILALVVAGAVGFLYVVSGGWWGTWR